MAAITVLLVANMRNLQLRTDISRPRGHVVVRGPGAAGASSGTSATATASSSSWRRADASEVDAERLEQAADRLVDGMSASGLFTSARSQLSEAEMLQLAQFLRRQLPVLRRRRPARQARGKAQPAGVREHVRQAAEGLLTSVLDDRAEVLRRSIRSGCWSSSTRRPARAEASPASTWSGAAAAGSSARITGRCSSSPSRACRRRTTSSRSG